MIMIIIIIIITTTTHEACMMRLPTFEFKLKPSRIQVTSQIFHKTAHSKEFSTHTYIVKA
jgi:hypothetical protein